MIFGKIKAEIPLSLTHVVPDKKLEIVSSEEQERSHTSTISGPK